MNDTFGADALKADLCLDEGVRLRPYVDTVGKVTIGVGRNLTDNGLSRAEVYAMLDNDVATVAAGLDATMPWWRTLPAPQQRVMANLTFNMGITRLLGFHLFLDAMQRHDWTRAAAELKDSRWFVQVGARGPRMLARIQPGSSVEHG